MSPSFTFCIDDEQRFYPLAMAHTPSRQYSCPSHSSLNVVVPNNMDFLALLMAQKVSFIKKEPS